MTSPKLRLGGLFIAMHHSKEKNAVVQQIVVKIPMIIRRINGTENKKPSNSLNLLGLFEKYRLL